MRKKIICILLLVLIIFSNVINIYAIEETSETLENENKITNENNNKKDIKQKNEVDNEINYDSNMELKNEIEVKGTTSSEKIENITPYTTEVIEKTEKINDGLVEIEGTWRVVVKGIIDYDYNGLARNENGLWYVKDGTILFDFTGIYNDEATGNSYLVEKNRVVEKNALYPINGGKEWVLVNDGKIAKEYKGFYKNEAGLWYVNEGKIQFDYTGSVVKEEKSYIIEENKVYAIVDKSATQMLEINNKWRMVEKGTVNYQYEGLAKNENGTWYFKNGELTFEFTGIYTDKVTDNTYAIEKNRVIEETKLIPINGGIEWIFVQNGKVDNNYKGFFENEAGLWYINEGKILFDYTGSIIKEEKSYVIEENKVYAIVEKDATQMLEVNNKWRMIEKGKVNYNYEGLAQNENGTWYFKNGELTFEFTGIYTDELKENVYVIEKNRLVEGTRLVPINDGKEWLFVKNGKLAKDYNDFYENEAGLWYIHEGKILFDYTGSVFKGNKSYIIEENKVYAVVEKDVTQMLEVNDKWRMIEKGKVNYNYEGLAQNENGTWYFKNGELTFEFTGIYTDELKENIYVIEKNRLVEGTRLVPINDGKEWLFVKNGKLAKDYNDFYENEAGLWYIHEGKILFDYTGSVFEGNKSYIIEENKVYAVVEKDVTQMLEVNDKWRMIEKGKVNYNYEGLAQNENGTWYFEAGELTFEFTGTYTDIAGITYIIEDNKVNGILSTPGYSSIMKVEQPLKFNKYISDSLIVSGWALSTDKNSKILIYVDGKLAGEAIREDREDIFEEYGEVDFGGKECNPKPGFYLDLSDKKIGIGKHVIDIKHISSNNEIVIQSREIEINITALSKTIGIDVSHYQGKINWEEVKNSGVTFAILKIGEYWTNSKKIVFDEYFEQNYNECKRLGIAVGGYFYSYAFNGEEGSEEADICLSLIKNKKFELPIFLDVEDKAIKNAVANGKSNVENVTNASIAFCEKMLNAGHKAGIYASRDFFYNYFDLSRIEKYWIWLAHYTSNQTDYTGKYDFWQYSSEGRIQGIDGNVDMDWYYKK